jgi:hypothetical protein
MQRNATDWVSRNASAHTKLGFAYCAGYAADSVRYYLVAELAGVGVGLGRTARPTTRRTCAETWSCGGANSPH